MKRKVLEVYWDEDVSVKNICWDKLNLTEQLDFVNTGLMMNFKKKNFKKKVSK